jgi:hypothetical protein
VTSLALTDGQCEPQAYNCAYQTNLLDPAQVHRTQSDICNQLLDLCAGITVGTTVEEVCRPSFQSSHDNEEIVLIIMAIINC